MSARVIKRPWRTQPPSGYRFARDSHLARLARFTHAFTPQSTVDLTDSGATLTPGPAFGGYVGGPFGLGWSCGAQQYQPAISVSGSSAFNADADGFWVLAVLNRFEGVDWAGGTIVGYSGDGNEGLGVSGGNSLWYWYSGTRLTGPAVPVGGPVVIGGWYDDTNALLFVNGQFASASHGGYNVTGRSILSFGGQAGQNTLNGNIAAVFAGVGKPSNEFFLRMWENPWQVFEPRRILVPVAAASGSASLGLGGAIEQERAGAIAAAPGGVSVGAGGAAEHEIAGGTSAAPGTAQLAIGNAEQREAAGGVIASSVASLALGASAERETAGGASVNAGAVSAAVGGAAEREITGGLSATAGFALALGGAGDSEAAGGVNAQPGVVTIAPGGYVEIELPGGLTASQGILVFVGGAGHPSIPGGLQAAPGTVNVFAGGAAEREIAGGTMLGTVSAVLLGGRADGEVAGGLAVAPGPAQIAVGGADELQRSGGFSAQRIGADVLAIGGCDDTEIVGGLMALVAARNSSRVYTVDAALRAYAVGPANRTAAVAPAIRG